MKKSLVFSLLLFLLAGCATPTAPTPPCPLFKITAGYTMPMDGEYKSQFLTRKIGSIAYMKLQIKGDSIRAWTENDKGGNASPRTEIEAFTAWRFEGIYLYANSFIGEIRKMDTAAFTFFWKDAVYQMTWIKGLHTTGIIEPRPQAPRGLPQGCRE